VSRSRSGSSRRLGAAYYIPTVAVPALLVTHAMIFVMLVTRSRH
jgi:hypothetical protein